LIPLTFAVSSFFLHAFEFFSFSGLHLCNGYIANFISVAYNQSLEKDFISEQNKILSLTLIAAAVK